MRKILRALIFISFCFILVFPVLAQETNTPTTSPVITRQEKLQEIRTRVREKIEARHKLIKDRRATVAARLTTRRQETIKFFFKRLAKRLQAAINRLRRLIARIESRLAKIEFAEDGINTTDVKATLVTAKEKLDESETALAEVQAGFKDVLANENPKEAFSDIKDLTQGIKRQLIEVHRLLVHVIGNIKGLRVSQGE